MHRHIIITSDGTMLVGDGTGGDIHIGQFQVYGRTVHGTVTTSSQ